MPRIPLTPRVKKILDAAGVSYSSQGDVSQEVFNILKPYTSYRPRATRKKATAEQKEVIERAEHKPSPFRQDHIVRVSGAGENMEELFDKAVEGEMKPSRPFEHSYLCLYCDNIFYDHGIERREILCPYCHHSYYQDSEHNT